MEIEENELKNILKIAFKYHFAYGGLRTELGTYNLNPKEQREWWKHLEFLEDMCNKYHFDVGEFK